MVDFGKLVRGGGVYSKLFHISEKKSWSECSWFFIWIYLKISEKLRGKNHVQSGIKKLTFIVWKSCIYVLIYDKIFIVFSPWRFLGCAWHFWEKCLWHEKNSGDEFLEKVPMTYPDLKVQNTSTMMIFLLCTRDIF